MHPAFCTVVASWALPPAACAPAPAVRRAACGGFLGACGYSRTGRALWASGTGGRGASDPVMQNDGNLVLYLRSNGRPTWSWKSGKL